jgi:predicted glycosyltransferase involved in capsule biosynthesis
MVARVTATQEDRERTEAHIQSADRAIWVTFQKEGIHKYPAALEDPKLADVSFLGYPHRHMFHFRVSISVFHNDRDIEFIQFKRWLEGLYSSESAVLELDYKSCEMIADDLYTQINLKYPGRHVSIEVSEDGENGCSIAYMDSRAPQRIFQPPVQLGDN